MDACYAVDDTPATKDEVLGLIAALACEQGTLGGYSKEDIYTALKAREEVGSTGFENGLAIPHCSLEKVDTFVSGILVVPGGVDFDSLDGDISRVFAFIIGPASERNTHIQLLSAYSRILSDPSVFTRISSAVNNQQLEDVFTEYAQAVDESHYLEERTPQNLVLVVLQEEKYFEDFLQVFAATPDVSISVIDSSNAGQFLHRMPLFSTFWSESKANYSKTIVAVIDRNKSNDLIRRMNTALESYENPKGVLITVQELAYTIGALEF